jgi:cytochrome c oxidase cbb3-type subunit III
VIATVTPLRRPAPGCRRHWAVLVLLIGWAAGCDVPGRLRSGERYVPPQQERAFPVLYRQNCAGCHGADGTLGPAPPLNDKLFLALIPDRELKRVIAEGRTGTLMPAFATASGGPLTAEQATILANGIKSGWDSVEPAPRGAPPYLLASARSKGAGAGSEEDGLDVFAMACASCHGDHGQGGRYGGQTVGAVNDPDFLALMSDQALRRLVITGRPDLGMPRYDDPMGRPRGFQPLSDEDVTNLVALLASWRQRGLAQGKL